MDRRNQDRRLRAREKLTTALLVHISLWALSIVILASIVTFLTTYQSTREQYIQLLKQGIAPKLEKKRWQFDQVQSQADILGEQFLERYQQLMANPEASIAAFDKWYEETSPGVLRLKAEFNRGRAVDFDLFEDISTFAGLRKHPIDDELKVRIIAAQYTLNELGPAWQHQVANSHFSFPENIIVMYSQKEPWGLLADKDLVITDFSVVKSTLQEFNPDRESLWTGLYYDISADFWAITYQKPVDLNGKHLVNASFDVGLSNLLQELIEKKQPNSEHLVLNNNGGLIAASNMSMSALNTHQVLTPDNYQEPLYEAIFRLLQEQPDLKDGMVLDEGIEEHLVIVNKTESLNWWYFTVYPRSEIQKQAIIFPLKLTLAGIALVGLILLMVYWRIRAEVSKPLRMVAKVASMMGSKNYEDVVSSDIADSKTHGEVRRAIEAFKTMAQRFIGAQHELEAKVEQRTAELAQANRRLEELAHSDGLTGLLNRRSFDRDLDEVIRTPEERYVLAIADIDDFKLYNDNYGHEAGDNALKAVAAFLINKSSGKCYRYGGEELAILLKLGQLEDIESELESIVHGINDLQIKHDYGKKGGDFLSISIGAAVIAANDSPQQAIKRADQQLYKAKAAGGNLVYFSSSP
ncbi:GGDEF domain-containing protein [Kangiella koreensis]|uniref:diguanylate cyclase n=1 Tax=Kangiella koreensis (strain DSM 16069 / JCM 12317 / KCTC 12182 / SW-125) TaxID=523791 RepID=C7R5P3_KANKD|nr:GGDEF domain-containing protein [Kangiella koreensis]ACV27217.1 diguanylate cyclase [Kangiella koreensis DSM 16069]